MQQKLPNFVMMMMMKQTCLLVSGVSGFLRDVSSTVVP